MEIKKIFDEISSCSGDIAKKKILEKYNENKTLKDVLYLACSKRVKFYLKQILEYTPDENGESLQWALDGLKPIISREYTGGQAQKWLSTVMSSISADDAYIIERIIDKDPKIGMGTTYINEVFPKLLEDTPYQGAKPYKKKLVDKLIATGNAVSQMKLDGRYQNAIIRGGDVILETRQGEVTTLTNAKFLNELAILGDEIVLNGELTIESVPNRRIANGMLNSLNDIFTKMKKRSEKENNGKITSFLNEYGEIFGVENIDMQYILDKITYTVWDMISVEEYFKMESNIPYDKRYNNLSVLIETARPDMVKLVETIHIKTFEEAMGHFTNLLSQDLEGTIVKDFKSKWKHGKGNHQIKLKLEMNLDLKIIGFQYGNKGTKNENVISTLLVESSCGLLKTNPSGMDEKMMLDVTNRQEELLGSIVEIRCCGLSQNSKGEWSTQHPSVVELRNDKDESDSLESALSIENSIKGII